MPLAKALVGLSVMLMFAGCAYTPPITTFDRTQTPVDVVGIVGDSFGDYAMADQSKSIPLFFGGNYFQNSTIQYNAAVSNSENFTKSLASINYDPEASWRRSLTKHLAKVGIEATHLEGVTRKSHLGLTKYTTEYLGDKPSGVDAYLDLKVVQWGFASKRDESTLRPYLLFNVSLKSEDGKETLMSETIQYNDINFSAFDSTIIVGDSSHKFETLGELFDSPSEAAQYLDASIDQIASEIALRLK